ncbi:MAG: hypothetical protein HZC36_13945 [Armatimonadetes bacterium]|nr:hypothetical protein [Armatimonadota bacterium]
MSLYGRILASALFFGLIALLVHPVSRPYYAVYLAGGGPSRALDTTAELPRNLSTLPVPKTLSDAATWVLVGVSSRWTGKSEQRASLRSMSLVAQHFAEEDPDNAFWLQSAAYFQVLMGDGTGAQNSWIRASNKVRWQDYQSVKLLSIARELQQEYRGPFAWHYASLLTLRPTRPAFASEWLAKYLLTRSSLPEKANLGLRMATLRNGVLIRDGATSLESANSGVRMIEYASMSAPVLTTYSPKRLALARFDLINRLRDAGLPDEANLANSEFLKNEAWSAIIQQDDPRLEEESLVAKSVLAATAPGAGVLLAILGLAIALLGRVFARSEWVAQNYRRPVPEAIGLVVGLSAQLATGYWLLSLALTLCFAFSGLRPKRVRSKPPKYLGPFFRFTVMMLGVAASLLTGLFVGGMTAPAYDALGSGTFAFEVLRGQTLPLWLAALTASVLLLVAATWAIVMRIPTHVVLGTSVFEFGATVLCVGALFGVVLAPVAVSVDRDSERALRKIVLNEPNYYLLK